MNAPLSGPEIRSEFADDEDFAKLLEQFSASVAEKRELFRQFHAVKALDEMRRAAHQLKGAAAGYGFPGLSRAASRLEIACGSSPDEIEAALQLLLDDLDRIVI